VTTGAREGGDSLDHLCAWLNECVGGICLPAVDVDGGEQGTGTACGDGVDCGMDAARTLFRRERLQDRDALHCSAAEEAARLA